MRTLPFRFSTIVAQTSSAFQTATSATLAAYSSAVRRRAAASVFAALMLGSFAPPSASAEELAEQLEQWKETYEERVLPIIESRCLDCHQGDDAEGEFDLSRYLDSKVAVEAGDAWDRVARRIRLNEMPPQGSPGLNDRQKSSFQRWVDSRPNQDLCRQLASEETQSWYRGHVMSRRLTRTEYRHAVSDLLGLDLLPGEEPPSDGAGGEGFDTFGDALFTSTIHLESWLAVADRLIETALPDTTEGLSTEAVDRRQRLLPPGAAKDNVHVAGSSDGFVESDEDAETCIREFARRAWRRPVTDDEVGNLMRLYRDARGRNLGFVAALRQPFKAILVSPHFLFVVETEPGEAGIHRLTNHQLATRLALMIWSSLPDERLLGRADAGELHDDEILRQETRRMLQDPRSRALGENFGLQWLGLREFLEIRPDAEVFPEYSDELAADMREEAIEFVAAVFREDRPLTDLLVSDAVYVNGRLARHYELDLPSDAPWQRVSVQNRSRGGVLTLGSVLTASSYPRRTSPVLRGRWILSELLGDRVPPPPEDVPALEETESDTDAKTLRQRLEIHRQKAECAACHDRMDPLGFGLENFDGIGRWRDRDRGVPIDATGVLPSGQKFSGPDELRLVLLERRDDFLRQFVRKLLGFSLGRELNKFDACIVDECLERLAENDFRSSVLIESIALSYPFQYRYYRESKDQETTSE